MLVRVFDPLAAAVRTNEQDIDPAFLRLDAREPFIQFAAHSSGFDRLGRARRQTDQDPGRRKKRLPIIAPALTLFPLAFGLAALTLLRIVVIEKKPQHARIVEVLEQAN